MFSFKVYRQVLVAFVVALGFVACDNDDGPTTPTHVTVTATLSLSSHNDTVTAGKTLVVAIANYKVMPEGQSTALTWSSSNASVATVSQNGTVTGVTLGTAYVVATSVAVPSVKDSVRFTVVAAPPLAVVAVSPHSASVAEGGQVSLNATGTFATGLSSAITWTTSNSAVATVSATGIVSGITPGSVLITATSVVVPSAKDTSRVTVTLVPQVRFFGSSLTFDTVKVGTAFTPPVFTIVADSGVSKAYTWYSSNPLVATIDINTGAIKAWAVGTTRIYALTVGLNMTKGQLNAGFDLVVKP